MSSHKGQRGFVFEVSASCLAMAQAERELGPLFVCFCRGRRQTVSEGANTDEDGRAEFLEPLEGMMVTLYKDKKQTAFESKEYKFKLREATPDGMVRTIAVVTVDMAEYLSVEETSCPTLQLMMETDGVDNAALMVDLSWGFAKEGKPDDDDVMSTQSAEEEIEDGPNEMDSSYRLPEEADDEETDERPEQDTSAFVQMRFSVFLQEEGEEEFDASCHPDWNLADVRNAVADQMDGRGLWVFMSDGAPVDPEEEEDMSASELDILQGHNDDDDEEEEDFSGLMDEEVRAELVQSKKAERQALRELESVKRMLEKVQDGGDSDLVRAMRDEMDKAKQDLLELQSTSDAELTAKTSEWQQAMDIGQDLLEKNHTLQDELANTQHAADELKARLEPMQSEIEQLRDIIADHEENAALIEEERQGMQEQRYQISELEGLRDMLEEELREKEESFEERLQEELDEQKDTLEEKHKSELEWEQQKTAKALEEAAAVAQDSHQQESEDLEKLKAQITDLQQEVDTVTRNLKMEQSFASAHKNEIKKGQIAASEAKKESKETLEKMKAKDAQMKKLEAAKADSDKLMQTKTQEIQSLKKELMVVRRELADHSTELAQAKKSNEELESKLEAAGDSAGSATSTQGGLMDMSAMTEMQSTIAEEYKTKYESTINAQKDKMKLLQAKVAQMQKKHEAELKDAERNGASVAMTKMAKAMKQAKKQQQKEAEKAQKKAQKQHQKELRRAQAAALAQGGAKPQPKKEVVQEGWLQKKGSKGIGKKGGKGWSWRWFIYKPNEHQLLYYVKEGPKMELKGTIEMKDATKVYVLDNKHQDKARQSFAVELQKRTYLLQAGDRKQMSKKYATGEAGDDPNVAEGIPPDGVDGALQAAAVARRSKELVEKMASSSNINPEDTKRASSLSDQQVGYGNAAFKSKDFAKAADAARLALELDAENMEASSLLKKAEQALKAAPRTASDSAEGLDKPSKPTAKPLQSTKGMFDSDDEDDEDDMFGD